MLPCPPPLPFPCSRLKKKKKKRKGHREHRGSIKGGWDILEDEDLDQMKSKKKKRSRGSRRWRKAGPPLQESMASGLREGFAPALLQFKERVVRMGQEVLSFLNRIYPVTHPDLALRMAWDSFLIVWVLYSVFIVPIEIVFQPPESKAIKSLGFAIDAFFLSDVILNFRTGFFDNRGALVRQPKRVAARQGACTTCPTHLRRLHPRTSALCRYATRWFLPDLASSLPFDEMLLAAGAGSSQTVVTSLLKLPRMLRITRITRYLERFKNANAAKLFQLILFMFLFTHLMGCGLYAIGRLSVRQGQQSFLDGFPIEERNTWDKAYLLALMQASLILASGG